MNKELLCAMFNCSMEQLNNQYAANAKTLEGMRKKAEATGKKVNNYTADQLVILEGKFKELAK